MMLSIQLLTLPSLLSSFASAHVLFPRETPFLNTTFSQTTLPLPTVSPSAAALQQKCCFLVQDTVNEAWWEQTSYQTETTTITTISYFVTVYPNTTVINSNSTVQTNTVISSRLVGANPLVLASNGAPGPAESSVSLTGTDPITTAGVTVPFPAAFYYYNSVRIITADAVLDSNGDPVCGTTSDVFAPINSNAQAYFGGGPVAVPATPTPVIRRDVTILGSSLVSPAATPADPTISPTVLPEITMIAPEPTPTVLQLTEPFIYLATSGALGLKQGDVPCNVGDEVEDYGYVPQTLLDYLSGNNFYADQYPWLKDCVIGGPTIVSLDDGCTLGGGGSGGGGGGGGTVTTGEVTATAIGGDLTEAVLIYVTPPGLSKPKPTAGSGSTDTNKPADPAGGGGQSSNGGGQNNNPNPTNGGSTQDGSKPNQGAPQAQQDSTDPSIGEIINGIMNGGGSSDSSGKGGQSQSSSSSSSNSGSTSNSGSGSNSQNGGSIQLIDGKPWVVYPSATNIPLVNAPPGISGTTTVIDGKSYLAIPGPVTYATSANPQGTSAAGSASHGTTILIGGVPFVVYPGGRDIPLTEAQPAGVNGVTKVINGTPYVVPPSATTVPAVDTSGKSYGKTTLINNTPYLVLPTGTPLPASLFPTGLGSAAKTTSIDGKEYLVIPTTTRVPLPLETDAQKVGQLTVIIDGSSRLVIGGPTTMPVNSLFDIGGQTTVIGGTTMVVVTGATTAAAKKTTSTSPSATRTPTVVLPAPTEQAPKSGSERMKVEVCGALLSLGLALVSVYL